MNCPFELLEDSLLHPFQRQTFLGMISGFQRKTAFLIILWSKAKTNCYSASLLLWLIYMVMPNNISARSATFVRQIQKFRALVTFTCWFVSEENDGISWKLESPTKSRFRIFTFYVGSPLLCRRGWVPIVPRCLYLMPSNGSRRVLHICENVNWLIIWCKNLINVWYF